MRCDLKTRREFLQQGSCFGLAVAAALGLATSDALALPVALAEGAASGNERRYPVPSADGVTVDRKASLILVRVDGKVCAFALSCPHQNAAVKWVPNDHRFQCTKHDSQYKPDGVYTSGHATRNMDRFPIRREGEEVAVDVTRVFHSDTAAAAWAAATVSL